MIVHVYHAATSLVQAFSCSKGCMIEQLVVAELIGDRCPAF